MTIKRTVTDVSWKSPDVPFDIDGKVRNWEQELGSPNLLLSQGWSLDQQRRQDCEGPKVTLGARPSARNPILVKT
jgi:hypothetical protein